ncbi:hypothetical protein EV424DRAFT_1473521 [Suillus variegatus]|nr:hypothetical protein EV424DRAFT_1473521 [Suillus variegatus]
MSCSCPRELEETIPATLLHLAFGQFIDDSQTHMTTEDDNNLVHELANVMLGFYENENKRVEAVSDVLARYQLSFQLNRKLQGTAYVMDADISINIHNHCHPFVIAEFKKEAVTSNSEPYLQALSYYLESTRTSTPRMSGSASPFFLLILFRPYIVFAGAVWTLRPAVQILSNPLAFNDHSTDTYNQIATACHMAAFCLKSLKRYNKTLPSESALANNIYQHLVFPYPTSFTSMDTRSKTVFSYTDQLEEDEGQLKRLIYFGTIAEGRAEVPVCIKFLPGSWFMVVMDRILAYNVFVHLPLTVCLPQSVFEAITKQLKTLHASNLVHGDIHDTNILINQTDQTKFMIIDFNWAGVDGVVVYPPYVNHTNINRPNDVRDGMPIKAAHDNVMIDFIIDMRVEK